MSEVLRPLMIGILVCVFSAFISSSTRAEPIDVGMEAPGFTLKDISGQEVSIGDFTGGKILLLFFATGCPVCGEEHQKFDDVAKEYKEDVKALTVVLDGEAEGLSQMAKIFKPITTLLIDPGEVTDLYDIETFPEIFVLDRKGIIAYRGPFTGGEDLEDIILKLTSEIEAPQSSESVSDLPPCCR